MTEDILFDNLYIGHSEEDAKKLAAESFDIKKTIEEAEAKVATPEPPAEEDDEEDEIPSFTSNPAGFVRGKVAAFVDLVKSDPIYAFKSHPETGAALIIGILTLFSMLGALTGVVGSGAAKKPIEAAKKTAQAAKDKAATAVAAGEKKEAAKKK